MGDLSQICMKLQGFLESSPAGKYSPPEPTQLISEGLLCRAEMKLALSVKNAPITSEQGFNASRLKT